MYSEHHHNKRIHHEAQLSLKFLALHAQMHRLGLKTEAQPQPTTHYIWRTRGDDKVRSNHAANNGKVFSWKTPPATGHPGEDYNCRCWAEPYTLLDASCIDDPPIESISLEQIAAELAAGLGLARLALGAARMTATYTGRTIAYALSQIQLRRLLRRPQGVPKDWMAKPAKKGTGRTYYDPKNYGNDIRIQKGNPNARFPKQQEDYVRWKKNGEWLDKNGKPSNDFDETHIYLDEFKFIVELFK